MQLYRLRLTLSEFPSQYRRKVKCLLEQSSELEAPVAAIKLIELIQPHTLVKRSPANLGGLKQYVSNN